ncbi:hypothetical protein N7495_000181 [Penicillium taxi]|uniref:uncharacterized protein n=1 Tax=Penicillium taxi TaxID=168475 RepID=UPI0025459C1F|nr:uncharacterized protein N7495_000181 [Penicillium taxi]KAJ5907499.1 hypothetical protein N7495_000181 [Penicillium taxi]
MSLPSNNGVNDGIQMDDNRSTITAEFYPSKRHKTSHHDVLPALQYDRYTIGWVCALHIEMAAARAMLDNSHEALPTHTDDRNTYILGNINQHNIVIACLPTEQYGTNNAAIVMTNMKRTFPAIRACLMVGVGGGVPSKADVRLGDIVVGTRVMQYDLGKVLGSGLLQPTATFRISNHLLGTVVSAVRSKHELGPSRVLSILQQKLGQLPYGRPDLPDRLFDANYKHATLSGSCDECDHSKLVPRSERMSDEVKIHYGAIASGNQVMRDGIARDDIARKLDVICFEMESAGLMDILPCLPIRGICDYSDSHKSKEWQRFAAATAAAYARELLEELPMTKSHTSIVSMVNPDQSLPHKRRQNLLNSLEFDQMNARKATIKREQKKTCRWFLSHPCYKEWLSSARLAQHHGFLWISGKPGAGKSTIMKFIYSHMKSKARDNHAITASFFFNARGEYLEKSILGMYRSLLFQLFQGYPDLQVVLDDPDLIPLNHNGSLSLDVLKELFANGVCALGQRAFTCFVDALDECDEQQVVDMVQYFEELAEKSTAGGALFRICFSSRHYPYIEIQRGIRLTLEDQSGHAEDLVTYITNRLIIQERTLLDEIQPQLLSKAAGVFMWVVLVIDILNKEYRRGGMALRMRLSEIPSDLNELFKDILRRDNEDMEAFQLCILWILYAKSPLRPQELYHALWSGLSLNHLVDSQIPDLTALETGAGVRTNPAERYIISSSKGLAETTKSGQPTVQFIHESVRDFLIKDRGLYELWPELGLNCESLGHDKLKQCCDLYTNHTLIFASVNRLPPEPTSNDRKEILTKYPFLEYASQNILYHANTAAKAVPQEEFLSSFPISRWIDTSNIFEKFTIRKYTPKASLFYILADKGCPALIQEKLKKDPQIHIFGERYGYPLFAGLANGNKDAVAALLNLPSRIHNGVDITEGFNQRKDLKGYEDRTPLSWAAQDGQSSIVELLLERGAICDELDRGWRTPLSLASSNGHETVARLLIDKGADVNTSNKFGQTPLYRALRNGHETVARLLIDKGADVNTINDDGETPLYWALMSGHEAVARLLIDKGADVNTCNKYGKTPLYMASSNGHEAVARLLIDKGADVNASNKGGETPLYMASSNGHETVARLLIDKGADVNTSNKFGQTPLYRALRNGHETVARLLIDKGADVNTSNKDGKTPLYMASSNGHEAVARLLIDKGADVNTSDKDGETPLYRALMNGHETVARLLIDKGADVNTSNKDGETLLYRALMNGHETFARLLIDKGADVNTSNKDGKTPLYWASLNGHEAVAMLLIDKGADVNTINEDGATPLYRALMNGHEAVAMLLIDKGADVNTSNKDGETPLYRALMNGHEAVAMLLIDKGADVNTSNKFGETPLYRALMNGHEAVARLLIDKGADVNTSDKDGETPLYRALMNGHETVARLLIDKGADVNTSNKDGETLLYRALMNGHETFARLLIDKGADVNTSNKDGKTPLYWASLNGHEAVAMLLIDKGADVNTINEDGATPLYRALMNGHEAVAMLLIDKGADVNTSNKDGETPLYRALMNGHEAVAMLLIDKGADVNTSNKFGETPLYRALMNGHEAVAMLLIDKGADVNTSNKFGQTPLYMASGNGQEAVARLLIDKGADVNTSNKFGETPLYWASLNGHETVARLLIDKGADVNTSDKDGETPLYWASLNGHEAVARLLIDKGADVNTSNKFGETPLYWASLNGHETVARLLIDKGADVNTSDKDGETPLYMASGNGQEAVARLLIDKGADVNTSNKFGQTPLYMASLNGHEAIARLLIDNGALV